jgi:hypothetical protein
MRPTQAAQSCPRAENSAHSSDVAEKIIRFGMKWTEKVILYFIIYMLKEFVKP